MQAKGDTSTMHGKAARQKGEGASTSHQNGEGSDKAKINRIC